MILYTLHAADVKYISSLNLTSNVMEGCSEVRESTGLGRSSRWLMVLESLETAACTAKTLALFFFLLVTRPCVCSYSCARLRLQFLDMSAFCFTLLVGSLPYVCVCKKRRGRKIRVWRGRFSASWMCPACLNSTALLKRSHLRMASVSPVFSSFTV